MTRLSLAVLAGFALGLTGIRETRSQASPEETFKGLGATSRRQEWPNRFALVQKQINAH